MDTRLQWGILGTGMIARALAHAINESTTGTLAAVGSRRRETAEQFGDELGVPRRYEGYDALLADPAVDVVYNALPNHLHAEWTLRCFSAGKHVLCEKPLGSHHAEAMAMVEAARDAGLFLAEAFMYRCHPQTATLAELVRSGAIGDVRLIHATFCFNFGEQPDNVRSQVVLSGGGIMDVGCYTMSMARLLAGAALGLERPAEPLEVKGTGHLNPVGGVDTWATAAVKFPGDILATLVCGMQIGVPSVAEVYGTGGRIVVRNPWFPGTTDESAAIEVHVNGEEPRRVAVPGPSGLYTIEVDKVAAELSGQQFAYPGMTWQDTIGNMKALDQWRRGIGLTFPCETAEGLYHTISRRPLAVQPEGKLPTGRIEGVAKPVARLILGTMGHVLGDLAKTHAMLDRYVECGGNALDCAYVYGSEERVGTWLRNRGVRDGMVIIGKGAASIDATPELCTEHLLTSLERMGVDSFDVWMMHRDNVNVPVGEFVDVLNEHLDAGRIGAFGGSNWTTARLEEANAWAAREGKRGFAASSPNFTLAHWNEPMWDDCVNAVDAGSHDWYTRTQLPLLAWSSQANGFFSGRFKPEDANDPRLAGIVRVWFNDGNWERLRRVRELEAKTGVPGIQLSLAYVLCQPMDVYALIGPETMDEMRGSFEALRVRLTAEEMAWLDLRG
ncbi:MAG: aldo/keto reductase [Armatimonadetes bacterium]|nr:aldo/keto reductase [Armatimonadota bacterium]